MGSDGVGLVSVVQCAQGAANRLDLHVHEGRVAPADKASSTLGRTCPVRLGNRASQGIHWNENEYGVQVSRDADLGRMPGQTPSQTCVGRRATIRCEIAAIRRPGPPFGRQRPASTGQDDEGWAGPRIGRGTATRSGRPGAMPMGTSEYGILDSASRAAESGIVASTAGAPIQPFSHGIQAQSIARAALNKPRLH